jgi:DNA polymerase-3 subunit chi
MSEIGFYHLTKQTAERALARLLGRTLQSGHRAVVLAPDADRVRALDDALWQQTDIEWLPHGTARTGDADLQPIWLTETDEFQTGTPNNADYLFVLDTASAHLHRFGRIFDLFDGRNPDSVAAARARYKAARADGHTLAYWQETERGWERAA